MLFSCFIIIIVMFYYHSLCKKNGDVPFLSPPPPFFLIKWSKCAELHTNDCIICEFLLCSSPTYFHLWVRLDIMISCLCLFYEQTEDHKPSSPFSASLLNGSDVITLKEEGICQFYSTFWSTICVNYPFPNIWLNLQ